MTPHGSDANDMRDAEDATWSHQQRLLSALRSGAGAMPEESDGDRYRDVFAALERESLPALPDDFALRLAADARRLADARAQVSRFKTMLAGLLSLLYLPAMLAVALLYGGELLRSVQNHPGSWSWVAVLLVLAAVPFIFDRPMRRSSAGFADD
jgi:hypothetical protein